jgi:hypothetical protein
MRSSNSARVFLNEGVLILKVKRLYILINLIPLRMSVLNKPLTSLVQNFTNDPKKKGEMSWAYGTRGMQVG